MAKLKTELESLDGLDDATKGFYVEHDGKFLLDADIPDVSGLKSALDKERKAARDAEAKRKAFEDRYSGVDPDKYAELLKKFEEDENSKLTIEERVAKASEKAVAAARKEIETAKALAEAEHKKALAFQGRVLDDSIRAAAAQAGLHKHAIDDALFRGRVMFTLDDSGNAVQRDADGNIVIGKDGKTPFSPSEWLESMRESAPHWFPAGASGSGSNGGGKGGGVGKPKAEWTPREKSEYIEKHGRAAYEALPYN